MKKYQKKRGQLKRRRREFSLIKRGVSGGSLTPYYVWWPSGPLTQTQDGGSTTLVNQIQEEKKNKKGKRDRAIVLPP